MLLSNSVFHEFGFENGFGTSQQIDDSPAVRCFVDTSITVAGGYSASLILINRLVEHLIKNGLLPEMCSQTVLHG